MIVNIDINFIKIKVNDVNIKFFYVGISIKVLYLFWWKFLIVNFLFIYNLNKMIKRIIKRFILMFIYFLICKFNKLIYFLKIIVNNIENFIY